MWSCGLAKGELKPHTIKDVLSIVALGVAVLFSVVNTQLALSWTTAFSIPFNPLNLWNATTTFATIYSVVLLLIIFVFLRSRSHQKVFWQSTGAILFSNALVIAVAVPVFLALLFTQYEYFYQKSSTLLPSILFMILTSGLVILTTYYGFWKNNPKKAGSATGVSIEKIVFSFVGAGAIFFVFLFFTIPSFNVKPFEPDRYLFVLDSTQIIGSGTQVVEVKHPYLESFRVIAIPLSELKVQINEKKFGGYTVQLLSQNDTEYYLKDGNKYFNQKPSAETIEPAKQFNFEKRPEFLILDNETKHLLVHTGNQKDMKKLVLHGFFEEPESDKKIVVGREQNCEWKECTLAISVENKGKSQVMLDGSDIMINLKNDPHTSDSTCEFFDGRVKINGEEATVRDCAKDYCTTSSDENTADLNAHFYINDENGISSIAGVSSFYFNFTGTVAFYAKFKCEKVTK